MDKCLKTLELDKILDMLAEHTSNEETRRMALAVRPDTDLERVRYECLKTSQALELSVQFGTPPFSNFKDVTSTAARAKSGAVISLRDLMDIAAMLRQIKSLADWYAHCENVETELSYLFSRLQPNDWLLEKLERSIISENEIADAASPELAAIRRKINRAGMQLLSGFTAGRFLDYPAFSPLMAGRGDRAELVHFAVRLLRKRDRFPASGYRDQPPSGGPDPGGHGAR